MLRAQREAGDAVAVAAGASDPSLEPEWPVWIEPALSSRTRSPGGFDGLLRRFAPDVVHLHTVVNPAALEWAARVPALITVQDHRYFCPGRGKWTRDGAPCREPMRPGLCRGCFEDDAYAAELQLLTEQRLAALRALKVVVLSRYMRDELVAAGLPPGQIDVVPPFVDGLDPGAAPDGPPCVAFVGRLVAAKGPLDALQAWRGSGLELPLVVAGRGPMREELERGGAEVVGWLERRELSALLRRARALLMPARWQEPFGIAGLEALQFGVPVVGYDSGGIREWHTGPGLVAWGDITALAAALRAAVRTRAEPAAGFERARLMARLREVYLSLMGRGVGVAAARC